MLSLHADSRRLFGNEFKDIGPTTAKARRPNVLRRWRGTTSWRWLAERRYWRRQRRTYSSPPGTGELCVADTDELSDRAWTELVRERRASASRQVCRKEVTDVLKFTVHDSCLSNRKVFRLFLNVFIAVWESHSSRYVFEYNTRIRYGNCYESKHVALFYR